MHTGKGSSSATTTQTPAAMGEYQMLLSRLNQVGSQPYTPYGGQLVADLNPYQTKGMSDMAGAYGSAQPFIDQASRYAALGASPIQASAIKNYSNPYQDMVTSATMNQLQNTEQANATQAMGAGLGAGGLFNDRLGVAQGQMANQNALANAQTLGGLNTANYNQALQAAQGDRSAAAQAAYTFGNLGQENLATLLQGAQGEMGAGQALQGHQQDVLNSLYGQWQQQQAFPYQQLSWMAGLGTGIGSQMGGTSSTTQYPQQPNPWSQMIGLGTFGLGAYNAYNNHARGGRIKGFAGGGVPSEEEFASGFIPSAPMTMGKGAPDAPKIGGQGGGGGGGSSGMSFGDLGKLGSSLGDAGASALSSFGEAFPEAGAAVADFLPFLMLRNGGAVRGYDTGGAPEGGTFGGVPFGNVRGYIPRVNIAPGRGAPDPPKVAVQQGQGPSKKDFGDLSSGVGKAAHSLHDQFFPSNSGEPINLAPPNPGAEEYGPPMTQMGGTGGDLGGLYRGGGFVRGFADGGAPDDLEGGFDTDPSDFDPTPMGGRGSILALGHKPVDLGSADFPFEPQHGEYTDEPRPDPAVSQGLRFPPDRHDLDPEPEIQPAASGTRYAGNQDEGDDDTGSAQRRGTFGQIDRAAAREADATGAPRGSRAWSNALMTAGLALMASRSPYLGSAIGEAGLSGLSAYAGTQHAEEANRKEAVREALDEKKYQTQLAKIDAAERRADKTLNLHTEQLAETRRYHEQQLQQGKVPTGFRVTKDGALEPVPGGPADPEHQKAVAAAKNVTAVDDAANEIGARQIIEGDLSPFKGARTTAQLAPLRAKVAEILENEHGMTRQQAAEYLARKQQEYKAAGVGAGAAARTAGVREENLNLILKVTDAAVPEALAKSKDVWRSGIPTLNRFIQNGQARFADDPKLATFQMANLQLAEGWAKAMNPTGVMRESDRDLALSLLSTARSPETYEALVTQLQKQIKLERDSIRGGAPAPSAVGTTNAAAAAMKAATGQPAPTGGGNAPPPATAAPTAPQIPPRPAGVPPGSAWSPSQKMWKSPDGHIYDANGAAVQ